MKNLEIKKIQSYIGFAKRSRNILLGVDDIIKSKNTKLIIISKNISDSSLKKIQEFANSKSIDNFVIDGEKFFEILQMENVKALGILDANLASAIKLKITNWC